MIWHWGGTHRVPRNIYLNRSPPPISIEVQILEYITDTKYTYWLLIITLLTAYFIRRVYYTQY